MWYFVRFYDRIVSGSVAEWLKAHDSKSCRVARLSEVRIPSLPPDKQYGSSEPFFVGIRIFDANPLASAKHTCGLKKPFFLFAFIWVLENPPFKGGF